MRSNRFPVAALALSALATVTLSVRPAEAGPANVELISVVQEGVNFRFNYNISLAATESIVAGDFFTIYDFVGLVPGSIVAPAGFTGSSALLGPNAPQTLPNDSAVIPNVTFTYNGAMQTGTTISGFSALSTFGQIRNGQFTADTTDATGPVQGGISSIGPVGVPQIPEPGTLALLGAGLAIGGMVTARRRRIS